MIVALLAIACLVAVGMPTRPDAKPAAVIAHALVVIACVVAAVVVRGMELG